MFICFPFSILKHFLFVILIIMHFCIYAHFDQHKVVSIAPAQHYKNLNLKICLAKFFIGYSLFWNLLCFYKIFLKYFLLEMLHSVFWLLYRKKSVFKIVKNTPYTWCTNIWKKKGELLFFEIIKHCFQVYICIYLASKLW